MAIEFTIHRRIASKISSKLRSSTQKAQPLPQKEVDDFSSSGDEHDTDEKTPSDIPSIAACKTHLKLLKVFAHLREDVKVAQEGCLLPDGSTSEDETIIENPDEKWRKYCQRAAWRFEKWWNVQSRNGPDKRINMEVCESPGALEALVEHTKPAIWSDVDLPPIDVLMVFHSYMLNPRCFLEDCIIYNNLALWKAGMPWDLVETCIKPRSYNYEPSSGSRQKWTNLTGCKWDNFDDDIPACTVTLPKMCFEKLHRSISLLQEKSLPIQGTLLSHNGEAVSGKSTEGEVRQPLAVNDILKGELGNNLLRLISEACQESESSNSISLASIEQAIHSGIGSYDTALTQPESSQTNQTHADQSLRVVKRTVETIISAHSQASIFSLDLAEAVIRQCTFIDAMQDVAWLHSPALNITLTILLQKYPTFIQIIGRHPTKIAVPTHAVDLAWHTHQLNPPSYYSYTLRSTAKERPQGQREFINHDDKISETILEGAFEWTSHAYEQVTGQNTYSECLCWHCTTRTYIEHSAPGHLDNLEYLVQERIAAKQFEKFTDDYTRQVSRASASNPVDRTEFLESYTWLYKNAVPTLTTGKEMQSKYSKAQVDQNTLAAVRGWKKDAEQYRASKSKNMSEKVGQSKSKGNSRADVGATPAAAALSVNVPS